MRRLLVLLALTLLPSVTHAQSVNCAKPASPVEKAICDDSALAPLDRLVARSLRFAQEADPAGAEALRADQQRWIAVRDAAYVPTNVAPLVRAHEARLRALIAKAGGRAVAAALAAASPIDPLRESNPQAEENTAFVAFVMTTLHPQPPAPPAAADEGDVLSTYELYAGFTSITPLPDGRLFAAVAQDCGAYQCSTIPFVLDRKAGTATRLAVEVPDAKGVPRRDPTATRVGMVTVANGVVEIFDQARGGGDCGTRWFYRVDGATLALVKRIDKPECDGKEWTAKTATMKVYR
ncbi:DUF1176 domain-containing protein [Azospirillum sp. sgz301742]